MNTKDKARVIIGIGALILAVISVYSMPIVVRTRDMLFLFLGGAGFGGTLVSYIQAHTRRRKDV